MLKHFDTNLIPFHRVLSYSNPSVVISMITFGRNKLRRKNVYFIIEIFRFSQFIDTRNIYWTPKFVTFPFLCWQLITSPLKKKVVFRAITNEKTVLYRFELTLAACLDREKNVVLVFALAQNIIYSLSIQRLASSEWYTIHLTWWYENYVPRLSEINLYILNICNTRGGCFTNTYCTERLSFLPAHMGHDPLYYLIQIVLIILYTFICSINLYKISRNTLLVPDI